VELEADTDEGKIELGVMVGLEEDNDDVETRPSELTCNVYRCGAVWRCENTDVVEVDAGSSE
jgi:hypothetical protein